MMPGHHRQAAVGRHRGRGLIERVRRAMAIDRVWPLLRAAATPRRRRRRANGSGGRRSSPAIRSAINRWIETNQRTDARRRQHRGDLPTERRLVTATHADTPTDAKYVLQRVAMLAKIAAMLALQALY